MIMHEMYMSNLLQLFSVLTGCSNLILFTRLLDTRDDPSWIRMIWICVLANGSGQIKFVRHRCLCISFPQPFSRPVRPHRPSLNPTIDMRTVTSLWPTASPDITFPTRLVPPHNIGSIRETALNVVSGRHDLSHEPDNVSSLEGISKGNTRRCSRNEKLIIVNQLEHLYIDVCRIKRRWFFPCFSSISRLYLELTVWKYNFWYINSYININAEMNSDNDNNDTHPASKASSDITWITWNQNVKYDRIEIYSDWNNTIYLLYYTDNYVSFLYFFQGISFIPSFASSFCDSFHECSSRLSQFTNDQSPLMFIVCQSFAQLFYLKVWVVWEFAHLQVCHIYPRTSPTLLSAHDHLNHWLDTGFPFSNLSIQLLSFKCNSRCSRLQRIFDECQWMPIPPIFGSPFFNRRERRWDFIR